MSRNELNISTCSNFSQTSWSWRIQYEDEDLVHFLGVGFHCTLLPVEATVVEGDEWGVTTGHVLLHCPDDSVESPVATLWFIHMMAAKQNQ